MVFIKSFAKRLVTYCVLPTTLFRKNQIAAVNKTFNQFWFSNAPIISKPPSKFSTVTLGTPISLWSYTFPKEADRSTLKTDYTPIAFQAPAEDGSLLCGTLFKATKHSAQGRTLLVFGGNGSLYKIGCHAWLLKLLQHSPIPFNIVMFDPRGCGNSEGVAHADGLIADGESIYQYTHTVLGVKEDNIDLCGFSLGAAIATLVKAKHPDTKGVLISNRSFQSLDHAVKSFFSPFKATIGKLLGNLASMITKKSGWILNPLDAWETITSPKMVICHKKDPVVRYCGSLEKALSSCDLLKQCHAIHLVQKNKKLPIYNHHVQPLSFYNDHLGQDAEGQIFQFLLSNSLKSSK